MVVRVQLSSGKLGNTAWTYNLAALDSGKGREAGASTRDRSPTDSDPSIKMSISLANSALLVIDMQEHFSSIAGHLVPRLLPLIQLYHQKGLPVYFTQQGHLPDDNCTLVRRWGPPGQGSILRYSDEWNLMPGLNDEAVAPHSCRITGKSTYNAFLQTPLEESLRRHGVNTVVVSGTLTNLCCETTAREAFCRNFDVVVLDDGCAAANSKHHRMALENLEFGFAEIWSIQDAMDELNKL
ncbi:hypothetical protein NM688_g7111 [Phlebia brevispora]|uniref:Uncharacterized protein n=1 Tax=Phlebia brevispora TaxID=194682 RepID=A0ACC1S917_9APHY|nr:hypothetical protein NM688_g7111 [Phlebia brevispora]